MNPDQEGSFEDIGNSQSGGEGAEDQLMVNVDGDVERGNGKWEMGDGKEVEWKSTNDVDVWTRDGPGKREVQQDQYDIVAWWKRFSFINSVIACRL